MSDVRYVQPSVARRPAAPSAGTGATPVEPVGFDSPPAPAHPAGVQQVSRTLYPK